VTTEATRMRAHLTGPK